MNQQRREVKNSGAVIDCQGRIHVWYNDLKRFFHPNRLTINLVIVHHLIPNCIEVIAYDPDRDLHAISRLYLDIPSLQKRIDQEEVCRRVLEKQDRQQNQQRGSCSSAAAVLLRGLDELVEEVEEDMMLTFLLSKVKVVNHNNNEEFAITINDDNNTNSNMMNSISNSDSIHNNHNNLSTQTAIPVAISTVPGPVPGPVPVREGEGEGVIQEERQGESVTESSESTRAVGVMMMVEGEEGNKKCTTTVTLCRERPADLIPCQVYFAKRYKMR